MLIEKIKPQSTLIVLVPYLCSSKFHLAVFIENGIHLIHFIENFTETFIVFSLSNRYVIQELNRAY